MESCNILTKRGHQFQWKQKLLLHCGDSALTWNIELSLIYLEWVFPLSVALFMRFAKKLFAVFYGRTSKFPKAVVEAFKGPLTRKIFIA